MEKQSMYQWLVDNINNYRYPRQYIEGHPMDIYNEIVSHLSYNDMIHLCQTDKYFTELCEKNLELQNKLSIVESKVHEILTEVKNYKLVSDKAVISNQLDIKYFYQLCKLFGIVFIFNVWDTKIDARWNRPLSYELANKVLINYIDKVPENIKISYGSVDACRYTIQSEIKAENFNIWIRFLLTKEQIHQFLMNVYYDNLMLID